MAVIEGDAGDNMLVGTRESDSLNRRRTRKTALSTTAPRVKSFSTLTRTVAGCRGCLRP
jgi:hypothetical protein